MHGGQKIVVFQRGRYIGQYALSPPPYLNLTVNGTQVVLKERGAEEQYLLDFSQGPPKEALINGDVAVFSR